MGVPGRVCVRIETHADLYTTQKVRRDIQRQKFYFLRDAWEEGGITRPWVICVALMEKDTGVATRFDTLDWLDWALRTTPNVRFRQDYLQGHDATIAMLK